MDFVNHHLKIGITHMFLFFDDPYSKAIPLFKNNSGVSCIICDREHWNTIANSYKNEMTVPEKQIANSIIAIKLARKRAYDWILHLDIDEFLYSSDGLETELSNLPEKIDTVSLGPLEAFSDQPNQPDKVGFKYSYICRFTKELFIYSFADKARILASKISYIAKREICRILGAGTPFNYRLNKGHVEGKCATRLNSEIAKLGPHFPYPSGESKLNIKISQKSWVLHYDSVSYDQWIEKWNRRISKSGEPIAAYNESSHRFKILLDYCCYIKKGGQNIIKTYYKNLYSISSFEYKIIRYFRGIVEIPRTHTPRFNESAYKKESYRLN
jgi:hypothetical protein